MKLWGFLTLLTSSFILTATLPAMAAPVPHISLFWEVQNWESVFGVVTAATANEKFEKGSRELFKSQKIDLTQPFAKIEFDGNKVRIQGLDEPLIMGATAAEFSYQNVAFTYKPKKSVKSNFEEMRKVWKGFPELNFPASLSNRNLASSETPVYATLFTIVGAAATLGDTGIPVGGYFGFKWYKNSAEPILLECSPGKSAQVKGKDRLVVEALPDGQQVFYSESGGQKGIQGELEKITLRGKESFAITNGNEAVNDLRIADAVELNKKLMAMKTLCSNPEEVEHFNNSSRRIQEAINAGKVKLASEHRASNSVKDPDSVSGIR
ncbi:hypothetical protein DOM22_02400 [Bdellovibrio sp. ZAP7]|uniref:hypothetical protein n=1 Tax=Bdellovibrio sp. ZAP7 TaxID=2231053 RepID=UPI00115C3C52|nr:hypothetical protein [Bdellovibrio sp. ZAP7]QDK44089.1 hypothetical protein DOM22_02400 [Bdellovibrio sp. ZAP7]